MLLELDEDLCAVEFILEGKGAIGTEEACRIQLGCAIRVISQRDPRYSCWGVLGPGERIAHEASKWE